MWGYENDNEFYEYAISKVLEHKSDELEQKLQEISEAKKRVIKKFLNYEKLDDRDYSLIKTNIDFFDFKFKKVREAVI